jgi:pimeloyl-ACP methyl ester carboxylesterase
MVREWLWSQLRKKKTSVREISTDKDNWVRRLGWTALALLLFVAGLRECDFFVSKLYFIPWPIYSDYVYPEGVQKVDFKSLDGTPLNGWYFHGKSPTAPKRPVLLYVHGNAGNMAAQYFQFSYLMDWGYDVFTFDYRGFGFSGGHPSREGIWKDTQAAFQELTLLQPGREYVVVGFSMGSPYALQLAAHEPKVSKAVYLTCFSSFREIGAYTLGAWGLPHWAAPVLAWLLIPNGLDARDAEKENSMPPALFVQGTWDGNIPYDMTQKVASDYSGPQTFLPMPNYPHGDYFKEPLGGKFHETLDRLFQVKGVTP